MGCYVPVDFPVIVVIQSAPGRRPHAGHMKTRDGRRVLFVADPKQAAGDRGICYARPDALSNFGVSWRQLVLGYHANPRNNPLGLLPAREFYPDEIYRRLGQQLGPGKTFILSAGWGLIPTNFLTPNYDITLRPGAEAFRLRKPADRYADFCLLPECSEEDLYFFGGAEYVPLFCSLTAAHGGRRIVFYRSAKPPAAPGCELRLFESGNPTSWHHECATAFLASRLEPRSDKIVPKVSRIEARLRALNKLANTSPSTPGGAPEPDARAVRAAVRSAHHDIEEYRWLTRSLGEIDVTKDEEYQRRFKALHRISQRSKQWHAAYFRQLEIGKVVGAEFVDVLYELWEDTGRYEPAYASRLVATTDPDKPVWERSALTHAGLRAPGYLEPNKLDQAAEVYRRLREWYAAYLQSPAGQRILDLFDESAPDFRDIGALKKLEFGLRSMRVEGRPLSVGGQSGA